MQGAASPPTFTLFANRALPRTYLRYVERSLREAFSWEATAVRVRVRVRNTRGERVYLSSPRRVRRVAESGGVRSRQSL